MNLGTTGQSIDYAAITPVLIVALGALAVLLTDLFIGERRKADLAWLTSGILVVGLLAELGLDCNGICKRVRAALGRSSEENEVTSHPAAG